MIEDRRAHAPQLRWSSPPVVLATLVIMGFFAALFTTMLYTQTNADIMIGALIAAVSSVIGYFFGSSSQSAGKDAAITDLTKTAATVAATAATQALPAAPIQAGDVAIKAETVTIDSKGTP